MRPKWRAYFELLRFPAVFTAIADIVMGFLVVGGSFQPIWAFALLVLASALIYLAGMVLNDVHDAAIDADERPHRPIPSGRISPSVALRLGSTMIIGGVAAAWLVGYLAGNWRPGYVATLLATCVVLYDMVLKSTPVAPLLMGSCRMFNVLLGMSLAESIDKMLPRPWLMTEWGIAIGIGLYICGVTIFARTESQVSSRLRLVAGMAIMFMGAVVAVLSAITHSQGESLEAKHSLAFWLFLGGGIPMAAISACLPATIRPEPSLVQFGVRRSLRTLILLDFAVAGLTTSLGSWAPLVILLLFVPMWLLERWASTT